MKVTFHRVSKDMNMAENMAFVGAGTGMLAAAMLQKGLNCSVFEEARPGGHIESLVLVIEEQCDERVLDELGKPQKTLRYQIREWSPDAIEALKKKTTDKTPIRDNQGHQVGWTRTHTIALEAGAEFIGDAASYPVVHKLFKQLGVQLDPFELNMDFWDKVAREHIICPPVLQTSNKSGLSCCSCFSDNAVEQNRTNISMHTILTHFTDLMRLDETIQLSLKMSIRRIWLR